MLECVQPVILSFPAKRPVFLREYGLESYTCRVLCVFLFIISIQEEFVHIVQMARLLIYVPTVNDSWVGFSEPPEDESPCDQDFRVAVRGMPMGWKIWSGIFMFFPRCVLWWWTACCGTLFLMETASIDNMIVNSVAMYFLLTIDNLIIQNLMGIKSMYLMEKADEYIIGDTPKPGGSERFSCFQILYLAFWKISALMLTLVLTVAMVYIYCDSHCWPMDLKACLPAGLDELHRITIFTNVVFGLIFSSDSERRRIRTR